MIRLLLTIFIILFFYNIETIRGDGYDEGNWEVAQWDIGKQLKPELEFAPFHIHVWAPKKCFVTCGDFKNDKLPVLLFVSSFAGQVSVEIFNNVMSGVAKHGIIVVGVDQKPGLSKSTNYDLLAEALGLVEGYVIGKGSRTLAGDMVTNGCTQEPRITRIFYGGHSAGNHVALQRIISQGKQNKHCDLVGGVVLLSPVDGQDPFGFGGEFAIPERTKVDFLTPALHVWGDLDPIAADAVKGIACAPEDMANMHFYDAWRGTIYSIEALNIGHMDIVDQGSITIADGFCKTIASAEEKAKYRTATKGAIVSFITGIAAAKVPPLKTLSNKDDLKIDFNYLEKKGEMDSGTAFKCTWDLSPTPLPYELETGFILMGVCFVTVVFTGLCIFIRRMDADNKEDWIVKIDAPLQGGGGAPQAQGSFSSPSLSAGGFNGTPSFNNGVPSMSMVGGGGGSGSYSGQFMKQDNDNVDV